MKSFKYTAIVWKEEGGYVSKCPELNVASCGDNFEEAIENLKEAVELYIENARELNIFEDMEESLTSNEKFTAGLELLVNA